MREIINKILIFIILISSFWPNLTRKSTQSLPFATTADTLIIHRKDRETHSMAADLYLLDECWEHIFKFLNCYGDDYYYNSCLKPLSIVSKQFLSITNRLKLSLIIRDPTHPFLARLFQRFPNLTLMRFCFMQLTQANNNSNSLMDFVASPQLKLKYLHMSSNFWLRNEHFKMFSSIFPNLQLLDLSLCYYISIEGICEVLKRCCTIRHLNLTCYFGVKLCQMNFEAPKLEVLNLSQIGVDEDALYVISKSCPNLLQLDLEHCRYVTDKGLKHVVGNCTQLRELNLRYCCDVHRDVLASLILSRPSLWKLTTPYRYYFNDQEMERLSRQGCTCLLVF